MNRKEATEYLSERYDEQVEMFPRLSNIKKEYYVKRNLRNAMRLLPSNKQDDG